METIQAIFPGNLTAEKLTEVLGKSQSSAKIFVRANARLTPGQADVFFCSLPNRSAVSIKSEKSFDRPILCVSGPFYSDVCSTDHRILLFRRLLNGSQNNWTSFQKELCAMADTLKRFPAIQWKQTSRPNRWGTMWFGHFDYCINNSLVHYPCVQKPTRKRMCRIRQAAPLASYCHYFLRTRCFSTQNKEEVKNDGLCRERGQGARSTRKKENSCSWRQDSGVDEQDVRGAKPTSRCLPCRPSAKAKSQNPSVLLRFSRPSFSLAS